MGPTGGEPAFWNGHQWVQRQVVPAQHGSHGSGSGGELLRPPTQTSIPRTDYISRTKQELARRAAVAEPGGQTPDVTVNGEALRLPQGILQPDDQGASASGSSQQKILPEKKDNPGGTRIPVPVRRVYPVEGQAHRLLIKEGSSQALDSYSDTYCNAPPVARCSCGKTVLPGNSTTAPLSDAEGPGEGPMGQGTQQT
ncbi:hypothetical protein V8E52_010364 [Russula decolorans]